jgi:hypothetical protein
MTVPDAQRLEQLAAEARYDRQRLDLYRAGHYGGRAVSLVRLEEFQHASDGARSPSPPDQRRALSCPPQLNATILREQLAPRSIPLASIVRCLVALVARRRTTASSAGTVGHRAS